jgi:hypothetical protein
MCDERGTGISIAKPGEQTIASIGVRESAGGANDRHHAAFPSDARPD